MATFSFTEVLRRRIGANFSTFSRAEISNDQLNHAAVAIVIDKHLEDERATVLLTRRSQHINRHKGQFALPGGRLNKDETVNEAALRELKEELGVELAPGALLGTLDDYATRSGFNITPVVFWGGGALQAKPDPNEVAQVFRIPVEELDSPDIPQFTQQVDGDHPVLYFPHLPTLGDSVYAPTAAILYQFREVALRGNNTRVAHYDQPRFAWK
ncbi:MAG: CoA pyrophosphatase [Rhodospirillales bacterium]|nr:CoA pyrophosphatase [Rhodospirillales bacterium]MDP6645227.1 CoA pyrophosphatase [Rhodospirillales bacterium]MDP6840406.1 CoA pyrophosphatase [Rhodospirillales bacterium]